MNAGAAATIDEPLGGAPALVPRTRMLMVCYACRPGEGSEPGLGWNRAVGAAKYHDVWVLCEESRNRPAIEAYLATHGPIPGLNFIYVPRGKWGQRLARWPGSLYLVCNLWHRAAYQVAQQWHARKRFDLVHMATYCGYREPGYCWKLPTTFVWGPVGGTHNFPWRFLPYAGFVGGVAELARSVVNSAQFWFSPRVRDALRKATVAIAGNSTTQKHVKDYFAIDMPIVPGGGMAYSVHPARTFRASEGPVRLLWVGRLHPLKGLPILLHALRKLPAHFPYRLRIVGEGPARQQYERLAKRLGVDQHIEWTGWVPHSQINTHYAWADEFVFTSLRDTMPGVVLEALAAGLPVISFDWLGMGDVVNERVGLKVPVTTPAQAIAKFADAIVELVCDPDAWQRRSEAAMLHARQYAWEAQAEQLDSIYKQALCAAR